MRVRNGSFAVPTQISVYRDHPPATNALLQSLELSSITLGSTFDGRTQTYTATAATDVTETTVTAIPLDPDATVLIKLNGVTDSDGTVNLAAGDNVITVEVTAEDGTTMQTYTVTVTRAASADATLSSLDLSDVTLSPLFTSDTTFYTATAPASAYETIVTATPRDPGATVLVTLTRGRSVTHANPDADGIVTVALPAGIEDKILTVQVTAANGRASRTYSILVSRGASADTTLRSLSLSGVTLSPSFASDTTSYTGSVANSVTSTMVAAATTHTGARAVVKLGNVTDADGTVDLVDGDNVIKVEVTAEDGSTMQTYTVTVTVTDNDRPGVTVTPTSLTIAEGSTGTYTVELNTQPTGNVTVAISSDNTDVTVSSSSLTFTTSNWNSAQAVTVTAGQDADTADDTAVLTLNPDGADYDSVSDATVTVTVTDNDMPGVTASPTSLTIAEGSTGTYTVELNTQPSAQVTVAISSDNTDVTADPASLTFTTSNWNSAQTVTVTAGQDDDAADGTAVLTHDPSGADYGSVSDATVDVNVIDDDTRGVTVTPTSLTINEGGSGTYTVVLDTQPTGDEVAVTINDPSNFTTDNTDVTASPSLLRFSTTNWNTAQTVTVSAAEDSDSAQDTATVMHAAFGADYAGFTASSVTVTVTDNDRPGVTVTPTSLTIAEGSTGTYTVELNTQPTARVTVAIGSDNPDVTPSSTSLTFSTSNWDSAQTVTVTAGQDADTADDTANLAHRPSGRGYGNNESKDVVVTVTDDDTAGLVLSAPTLGVDEAGQNTYTVKLATQPTTTVTVTATSGNMDTATVSGSTLTFTTSDWDTAQTVTVSGVDDGDSVNETVTVTNTASGGEYAGVTETVTVTVDDDDKPGITFTPASLTVDEVDGVATGTYNVKLNTMPTADVTVAISSDNPDVTVDTNSLTFTSLNWDTEQPVNVTIAQDADAADDTANLTHRPSGGGYGNNESKDFIVTVTDDDTAGLTVTPTSLEVHEGSTGTYTVELNTQPSAQVTVAISSDNPDVTPPSTSLTFSTSRLELGADGHGHSGPGRRCSGRNGGPDARPERRGLRLGG